jgi:arginine utilization regulatory protein
VRGLGDTRQTPVDVRMIAATQEPLGPAVADRSFRPDLQARLDGLTVVLPPLRARREDITPLFLEFLRQHCGGQPPALEPKLVETLCLYDWPLNVRELVLLARRLLGVQGHEPVLRKSFLPERMLRRAPDSQPPAASAGQQARRSTDDDSEFEALIEALRRHGGSVAKAAAAMGINRARAYRLLSAHPDLSVDDL